EFTARVALLGEVVGIGHVRGQVVWVGDEVLFQHSDQVGNGNRSSLWIRVRSMIEHRTPGPQQTQGKQRKAPPSACSVSSSDPGSARSCGDIFNFFHVFLTRLSSPHR